MVDKLLLIFIFAIVASTFAYHSFENYNVYSVIPDTDDQVQLLTDLRKEFDFWEDDQISISDDVRILVAPNKEKKFLDYLNNVGLKKDLLIKNVQELIDHQMRPPTTRTSTLGSFSWDYYQNLTVIYGWLDELEQTYPNIVKTVNIGQSSEGRDIKGVIIDFKAGNRDEKPLTGMIEGGIHAREWISPATVTWIIKEFLVSDNPEVRFMAETFVWHIFPVVNPDGYAYTFTNNRMWRKNRNTANYVQCGDDTDIGNGIDLNRNFNFVWMSTGATQNPCDNTYAGPNSTSELEAQAISNYVLALKNSSDLIYYFAFHSYGQMILVPYSHVIGYDVLQAENYADMYEIAARGSAKLESVHGTSYIVGPSAEILYPVSGSSFDWVKGVADVPIVYLFELRDTQRFGFLLPPEQIVPNNEEIMACLTEMDRATRRLGYYNNGKTMTVSILLLVVSLYSALLV